LCASRVRSLPDVMHSLVYRVINQKSNTALENLRAQRYIHPDAAA
jgi:hypothetical protein